MLLDAIKVNFLGFFLKGFLHYICKHMCKPGCIFVFNIGLKKPVKNRKQQNLQSLTTRNI